MSIGEIILEATLHPEPLAKETILYSLDHFRRLGGAGITRSYQDWYPYAIVALVSQEKFLLSGQHKSLDDYKYWLDHETWSEIQHVISDIRKSIGGAEHDIVKYLDWADSQLTTLREWEIQSWVEFKKNILIETIRAKFERANILDEMTLKPSSFWGLVCGMLQINWATCVNIHGLIVIYFVACNGNVFDILFYHDLETATSDLKKHKFSEHDSDAQLQKFKSPSAPFVKGFPHPVYSSGEFWQGENINNESI